MIRGIQRWLPLFGLVMVLGYTAWFVAEKEQILAEGQLVLFELAPVDPRSLLQGDVMRLRYAIGDHLEREELPAWGYLVFRRDPDGVATFQRIQSEPSPLKAEEGVIQFRRRRAGGIRNGTVKLGMESYFFEEGAGEKFAAARYGGMRIDGKGRAVLIGLYDEQREPIR